MRLIDADALKSEIEQYIRNVERFHEYEMIHAYEDCCSAIDEQPTISLKTGRWIKMSDADGIYWDCSECGESIPRISHFDRNYDLFPHLESINKTNYCPNCGCRMEEVTDDGIY